MRVLMYSPLFYPSIGGLETVALILAQEFVKYGHKLKVVSQVPISRTKTFSFEIIPRPGIRQLVQLVEWSDLYFQPNISLKGVYPLLLKPKPWVISHNNWYCRSNDRLSWQDYLKHFLIRFAFANE